MGEVKGWRRYSSGGVLLLANNNNNNNHWKKVKHNQRHCCWLWPPVEAVAMGKGRRRISWSVVCGVMLFTLGLISLFTGHVASNLEWYSQKLVKHRLWYSKVVMISTAFLVSIAAAFIYSGIMPMGVSVCFCAYFALKVYQFPKFRVGSVMDQLTSGNPSPQSSITDAVKGALIMHVSYLTYYDCYSWAFVRTKGGFFNVAPVHERLSNGYLLIGASGGLNQQRTGITDAVVVARILNATLVVPELDHHSFWKDDSDFANIFDVNWFISFLAKDVPIVKRVPDKYMRSLEKPPYTMRVPRKSEPQYYLDEVLPILLRRHVVQLTKFDYRLASDLNEELQRLRCRVNYHAFRFTKPLQNLGNKLVMKMRKMANRFIAVHLRFEPDMLAFSGCYYGGGDKERYELGEIRKRWTTLPEASPDGERKRGKCPLTPYEVGLMLRALGFKNDTYIYVASGEIYGGEETLQPLRELFPNFYTKEMLAGEELDPFLPFSSRLAAIDYIVCDESDVFVTNNNGNMAKILAGRRRYMGHKRTIRPNAKKLSALFLQREKMLWTTFSSKVKSAQRGFMGEPDEMKPGRGDFHEYPSSCICKKPFKLSDHDNHRNRTATKVPFDPEAESKYGRNEEDQGVNSMQGIETRDDHNASSSLEEKEDDDFLAD
ncbi:hypothetical protein OSB04_010864 [Centaurea solstitialis]|uniref:O-fucosyltransferase family protein n=1 Tax=Centaurea solstitialis TaxID=347529 RepID=A0AA38WL05_9ASTR|nr:hypothetical protein OSB04_010864 [Centaurea solstitialis]